MHGEGFTVGLHRYQAGDYGGAAAAFLAVLQQDPRQADALRLCGLSLVRAGRAAEALPLLARAVAIAPRTPLAHLHHGIALLEAGQAGRATARFRRAAMLDPAMPAAWINFSAALLALGEAKAARAAARRALRLSPHDPDAVHALARGHAALGDRDSARAALLETVKRAPGRADAWLDLGLAEARAGRIHAAQQAMERALQAQPGHPAATANRAALAVLTGDAADALDTLRDILDRDPGCLPARLNLANALLLDREVTEVMALLAGAPPRGREGAYWRAHLALAQMLAGQPAAAARTLDAIPPPYGDAEILIVSHRMQLARLTGDADACEAHAARLTVLIGEDGSSVYEHRVIAAFELARLRLGQGDADSAFAHWRDGHRLMQRVQPFSRAAFTSFVDASIAAFPAAAAAAPDAGEAPDRSPVFIIGLPRSGTTLTEQILAAHAAVHGAGERRAVHDLVTRLAGPSLEPEGPHRLAALAPQAMAAARSRFLAALHAAAPGDRRIILDKMPANALHLGFITALLPGARFILCRRDLRDTGLSIFQHRFFGYHPYAHDLADLGVYMVEHERLLAHWRAVVPGRLIEVALADWVGDFAGTLARLEAFLDLPHDPACGRFHESGRRVRTASAAQVRQPINARGLGRWRAHAAQLEPMIAPLAAAGLLVDGAPGIAAVASAGP